MPADRAVPDFLSLLSHSLIELMQVLPTTSSDEAPCLGSPNYDLEERQPPTLKQEDRTGDHLSLFSVARRYPRGLR